MLACGGEGGCVTLPATGNPRDKLPNRGRDRGRDLHGSTIGGVRSGSGLGGGDPGGDRKFSKNGGVFSKDDWLRGPSFRLRCVASGADPFVRAVDLLLRLLSPFLWWRLRFFWWRADFFRFSFLRRLRCRLRLRSLVRSFSCRLYCARRLFLLCLRRSCSSCSSSISISSEFHLKSGRTLTQPI